MPVQLRSIPVPDFGQGPYPGLATPDEFLTRLVRLRAATTAQGYSHLLVYADREHFANLAWLTGFEPRFEEAVLILGPHAQPLLLTGIECEGYLPISPLYRAGALRYERWDEFSLPDIPQTHTRPWADILAEEGITATSRVGIAGWKTYRDPSAIDAPTYLTDAVRQTGATAHNAAALFNHPLTGLRARCSASEIALFEWTNTAASNGIRNLWQNLRLGATDHELAPLLNYNGSPTACHWTLKTGPNRISLASPQGHSTVRGGTLSANACYWGANCCRAAWLVSSADELPAESRDYLEAFAAPYFEAMAGWFERLKIGTPGGELDAHIRTALPPDRFSIKLNPGHLIHLEEWLSSPIYPGSTIPLASGMVLQSDVSPGSKTYFTIRMEDGYALADAKLQSDLETHFPAVLARCIARRAFMRESLGLPVPDEVLPLSNLPGAIAPFALSPNQLLTLAGKH